MSLAAAYSNSLIVEGKLLKLRGNLSHVELIRDNLRLLLNHKICMISGDRPLCHAAVAII